MRWVEAVQREGHALAGQARKHRALTGLERARVAVGQSPPAPRAASLLEIAMPPARAASARRSGRRRRPERLAADPRQHRKQVGHTRRRHDLVEALEALAAKALRVIPRAVVRKLVHAHEKARRPARRARRAPTCGRPQRASDLRSKPSRPSL